MLWLTDLAKWLVDIKSLTEWKKQVTEELNALNDLKAAWELVKTEIANLSTKVETLSAAMKDNPDVSEDLKALTADVVATASSLHAAANPA